MSSRPLGLILVGAGSSRRMHGIDKVWTSLAGKPIIWHSLSRLSGHASATVLVVHADQVDRAAALAQEFPRVSVVPGGPERQDSVRCGLAALPSTEVIAVHDVARPLATQRLLEEGLPLLEIGDGAIPVTRSTDTIKRVDRSGAISETVDRGPLRAAQTLQLFRAATLRQVHADANVRRAQVTDDASLLEICGFQVMSYEGALENFKITTTYDLLVARLLVEGGHVS